MACVMVAFEDFYLLCLHCWRRLRIAFVLVLACWIVRRRRGPGPPFCICWDGTWPGYIARRVRGEGGMPGKRFSRFGFDGVGILDPTVVPFGDAVVVCIHLDAGWATVARVVDLNLQGTFDCKEVDWPGLGGEEQLLGYCFIQGAQLGPAIPSHPEDAGLHVESGINLIPVVLSAKAVGSGPRAWSARPAPARGRSPWCCRCGPRPRCLRGRAAPSRGGSPPRRDRCGP